MEDKSLQLKLINGQIEQEYNINDTSNIESVCNNPIDRTDFITMAADNNGDEHLFIDIVSNWINVIPNKNRISIEVIGYDIAKIKHYVRLMLLNKLGWNLIPTYQNGIGTNPFYIHKPYEQGMIISVLCTENHLEFSTADVSEAISKMDDNSIQLNEILEDPENLRVYSEYNQRAAMLQ